MRFFLVFVLCCFSFFTQAAEVSIVSYNVENLFDSLHDEGHEDFTYLPKKSKLKKECKTIENSYYRKYCQKLNWTPEKVEKKYPNTVRSFLVFLWFPIFLP
jgi:hypothetical protein